MTLDLLQQKRKLRIFISNTFNPAKPDAEDGEGTVASWELRVEGRLLEDVSCILNRFNLLFKFKRQSWFGFMLELK